VNNPAKRYAGQLMGRWITVFGAGMLAPVARRFKGQMNEVAKAAANFEDLPEADHNTLAGTQNPEDVLMPHIFSLFLRLALLGADHGGQPLPARDAPAACLRGRDVALTRRAAPGPATRGS